jgi:N-acetylmuramoyl-L-alanine amidase
MRARFLPTLLLALAAWPLTATADPEPERPGQAHRAPVDDALPTDGPGLAAHLRRHWERHLAAWPAPSDLACDADDRTCTVTLAAAAMASMEEHAWDDLVERAHAGLPPGWHLRFQGRDEQGGVHADTLLRARRGLPAGPLPWWLQGPWSPLHRWLGPADMPARGEGPLAGRRIALSPGHGLFWTGDRFATQRSDSFGLIEDDLTATIVHWHVDPFLLGAGAQTVWMRERDRGTLPPTVREEADAARTGTWTPQNDPLASQGQASTAPAPADAAWTVPPALATGDPIPVYVRWVAGPDRPADARLLVDHAGGTTVRTFDQRRGSGAWHHAGTFAFLPGQTVRWSHPAGRPGVLSADALRFGSLTGVVVRSGTRTGQPAWREAAVHHAEATGAPAAVWQARATVRDSDVVVRPLWSNLLGVDAYVSVHTNAAGGTGTETFMQQDTATAGSDRLRAAVHRQLVGDIRAHWNAAWVDRGEKTANFGEIRELTQAPGALIEIAFHDRDPATGPDVDSLHHPRFRRIAGRAIARGVVRFFAPDAPFAPEPPLGLGIFHEDGDLVVRWTPDSERQGGGPADRWRVHVALDGRAWDDGTEVPGDPALRLPMPVAGTVVSARVAGINAGGTGMLSQAVSAVASGGSAAPPVLLVAAFDRWDRATGEAGNRFDYLIDHAQALADARMASGGRWAADGISHQALDGLAAPDPYAAIVWQSGEQSTADLTFTPDEQVLLRDFVDAGGVLIASGAEIGWHLTQRGTPADLAFFTDIFAARFVADGAGTFEVEPLAGATWQDLPPFAFDNGSGPAYPVEYADVLDALDGAFVGLRYRGQGGAAVVGPASVLFGFPLETVLDPVVRSRLLQGALIALRVPGVTDDGGATTPPDADAGPVPDAAFVFDTGPLPDLPPRPDEDIAAPRDTTAPAPDGAPPAQDGSAPAPDAGRPVREVGRPDESLPPAEDTRPVEVRGGCAQAPGTPSAGAHALLLLLLAATALRTRPRAA